MHQTNTKLENSRNIPSLIKADKGQIKEKSKDLLNFLFTRNFKEPRFKKIKTIQFVSDVVEVRHIRDLSDLFL